MKTEIIGFDCKNKNGVHYFHIRFENKREIMVAEVAGSLDINNIYKFASFKVLAQQSKTDKGISQNIIKKAFNILMDDFDYFITPKNEFVEVKGLPF